MRREMSRSGRLDLALVILVCCGGYCLGADVPLVDPWGLVRILPPAAGKSPEIQRDAAIRMAVKLSGFGADSGPIAELKLYADVEGGLNQKSPRFPYHEDRLAWLVSFPEATYNDRDFKGRNVATKWPITVVIDATSGSLLGAFGESGKRWARRRIGPVNIGGGRSFGPPVGAPRLTIREVLEIWMPEASETGQCFIRFLGITGPSVRLSAQRVTGTEDVEVSIARLNCWVCSRRGVVIGGYTGPNANDGQAHFVTSSDRVFSDLTGKSLGGLDY